jgi:hypothetical protein
MNTAADLTMMRETQELAMPGTAIIYDVHGSVSDGQGGYYDAPVAIGTVPARLYPQTSRTYGETTAGAQVVSETAWFITMPWDTVVDATHRISMEGRTWEVVSVNNDESWRTAIRARVESLNEEIRT